MMIRVWSKLLSFGKADRNVVPLGLVGMCFVRMLFRRERRWYVLFLFLSFFVGVLGEGEQDANGRVG